MDSGGFRWNTNFWFIQPGKSLGRVVARVFIGELDEIVTVSISSRFSIEKYKLFPCIHNGYFSIFLLEWTINMLQEQIKNSIKEAMMAKDTVRLETLRAMSA